MALERRATEVTVDRARLSVVEFGIRPKQFVEPVPLRRIHDVTVQCQ
jgi:hypothetical protein